MKKIQRVILFFILFEIANAQIVTECATSFTPMISENFDGYQLYFPIMPFSNNRLLSNFAQFTNSASQAFVTLANGAATPRSSPNMLVSNLMSVIEFDIPIHSFGGYFTNVQVTAVNIDFSFYASDNTLINNISVTYDSSTANGAMKRLQYCSTGNTLYIKKITINANYVAIDDLSVAYTEITSSSITSSEISTSEITTQSITSSEITSSSITSSEITSSPVTSSEITSSPITSAEITTSVSGQAVSECAVPFIPMVSDNFDNYLSPGDTMRPFNNNRMFSNFATITNSANQAVVSGGSNVARPTSPPNMITMNQMSTIVFDSPIHSFGGYYTNAASGGVNIDFSFYNSTNTLINTISVFYDSATANGVMKQFQYCSAPGLSIKKITISANYVALDDLSIAYTQITSSSITSSSITSSKISTSDITSNVITSSEITSSPITSSEITTHSITSSEIMSSPITSAEITTHSITSSEITSSPITSSEITSSEATSSEITSSEITTSQISSGSMTTSQLTTDAITSNSVTTKMQTLIEDEDEQETLLSQDQKNKMNKKSQNNTIIRAVLIPVGVFLFGLIVVLVYKKTNLFNKFKNKNKKSNDAEMAEI